MFWSTFWTPDPFNSKRKLQNMWSDFSVLDLFLDLRSFQLKAEGAKYVSQNMKKLAQNWYFWSKTQGGNACSNTHFPFVKRSQKLLLQTTTDYRQTTSDEHGFLRPSYTIAPSGQKKHFENAHWRKSGVQKAQMVNMPIKSKALKLFVYNTPLEICIFSMFALIAQRFTYDFWIPDKIVI